MIGNKNGIIRNLAVSREVSEKQVIEEALSQSQTVEEAAAKLGISSTAVWRWLRVNGYKPQVRLELVKRDHAIASASSRKQVALK